MALSHQKNMIYNITKEDYYALYQYGSRVYGTIHTLSDWDYVGVENLGASTGEIVNGNNNIKVMGRKHFQKLLDEHNITALECYFLPNEFVVYAPISPWNFKLDLAKLRKSISEKSNHSWVKAKKKFKSPYNVPGEILRGKKSLFHSLRIVGFGIQIATRGLISNYSESNWIFEDIMSSKETIWQPYEKKWKPIHNHLMSEFRKVAPKSKLFRR